MNHMTKEEENNTKQKILDSALEEFGEYGFDGARVDRVAKAAGVNKAMLYYYFSSKENLFREVVRNHFLPKIHRLGEAIDASNDLESILLEAADTYRNLFHRQDQFLRIALRELAKPKSLLLDEIGNSIRGSQVPAKLGQALLKGMESGELRKLDLHQTVISFLTMNIGYYLASGLMNRVNKIDDVDDFTEKRKRAVVDLFLYGVKKR